MAKINLWLRPHEATAPSLSRQVIVPCSTTGAGGGAAAAAQINADLVAEDTRQAVAANRDPFSPETEARGVNW